MNFKDLDLHFKKCNIISSSYIVDNGVHSDWNSIEV